MDAPKRLTFSDYETIGREIIAAELLRRIPSAEIYPTTDPYNPIDLYARVQGYNLAIEIKTRKAVFTSGMILEEPKLQALLSAQYSGAVQLSLYANIIGEDIYWWRITPDILNLEKHSTFLPATTSGTDKHRLKEYRLLNPADATIWRKTLNN